MFFCKISWFIEGGREREMRENEGRWSAREKKNDFVLGRGEIWGERSEFLNEERDSPSLPFILYNLPKFL